MNRIFNRILNLMAFLAGLLLVIQMLIVCWEVSMRYFFNSPTSWVIEIAGYTVLWIPFLGAPWILMKEGHVRMDLFLSHLSRKNQIRLNILTSCIAVITCLIVTWFGIEVVLYLYQTNFRTETGLMLPKWPLISIIPISTFLLCIEYVRRMSSLLKRGQ